MDTEFELAQDAYFDALQDEIGWADSETGPFLAFVDNEYHNPSRDDYAEAYERFQEAYRGEFEDVTAYAAEYIESCFDLEKMLGSLRYYFDYESFGRDMILGGDIWTADSADGVGVYIFCNNC